MLAQTPSTPPATTPAPAAQTPAAPDADVPVTDTTAEETAKYKKDHPAKDDKSKGKDTTVANATKKEDSIPSPGEDLKPHIVKGSEEDVDAVGQRNIGGQRHG